jgi:serine/threonine protein kinase
MLAASSIEKAPCRNSRPSSSRAVLFQALAYVYSQEIIHRDLKPNNLILVNAEEDPIPKIVDFGLAIVANRDQWDQDTGVGHIVGTPAYMAPEQVEGSKLGPACDVYALGQVIWELRMGQPAFSGSPLQVLSQKISRHDSLRIDTVELPGPRLSQVVADCTHVDPKNRPGANDVVSRLWEILRRNEPPIS